jgi:hypothetical protein
MYFCPNCSYSFDIVKSSQVSSTKDTRTPVDKLAEALKKLEAGEDLSKYVATFNRDETNKNKKYQKLEDADKIKFNQIFEEITSMGAEFKCNNCNNNQVIKETILLYNINMEEKNNVKMRTLEENEFICKDPILPRTHDYTCKNPNCITHKQTSKKESVFFKEKDSFRVNYICCVCFYSW